MIHCRDARAQYGLGFSGQEVVQDQRTGLSLNTDKDFCYKDDFDLSFDLSFLPNRADYFGYIVRIIENDKQNVDLIYDRNALVNHFKIIRGDKFSTIAFDIDTNSLFHDWNHIRIHFNAAEHELSVSLGHQNLKEKINLPSEACLKVLFGANDYRDFKTTDLPAMKLRNIEVREDEKKSYRWPLDENDGLVAVDERNGRKAAVNNPMWIKKMHDEWQLLQSVITSGEASVAFDARNELLYLAGADSLLCYDVPAGLIRSYPYRSGVLHLANGNQSVFDTVNNRLINFCLDQQTVSVFNFETQRWDRDYRYPADGTHYLHLNKFYHASDSSCYFFGGYGHFLFKNEINRYHFSTDTWDRPKPKGSFLTPRYLAALGATEKGAYILGGYGSVSGQQMLNPKNLYDLSYYDIKSNTLSKRYELKVGPEDFAFANSLVIDEPGNGYYGLVFPKHKYHSSLQLIKGSLTQDTLRRVGSEIPYLFHDVHSYADLFYCKAGKRFIAVTLFHDENSDMTTAQLYSLYDPPLDFVDAGAAEATKNELPGYRWLIIFLGLIGLLVFWRRRKQGNQLSMSDPEERTAIDAMPVLKPADVLPSENKNAIFLFGTELQLIDAEGNDITKQLTPLLKELFLVILLYSIHGGRGISSEKLTELLWFDKTVESARNNRSVNIAKLKGILEKMDHCSISKETGLWKIHIDYQQVQVDYKKYLNIVSDKTLLDKQGIIELSAIVQRGAFLSGAEYEWLDPFKSEISNEVIDTYIHFANSVSIADDPEFMVQLASYIFYFDPVNEEAMTIKCKALSFLGKHSLATQAFENFCKEYEQIYGEIYAKDFRSIIS